MAASRSHAATGLVYSTDRGRICPGCRRPAAECVCRKPPAPPAAAGPIRVMRQSKGRGGKTVSVVTGLPLAADALASLGAELKRMCGTGGTVKDGTIEIQGDHCDALLAELARRGFPAKRAGG